MTASGIDGMSGGVSALTATPTTAIVTRAIAAILTRRSEASVRIVVIAVCMFIPS